MLLKYYETKIKKIFKMLRYKINGKINLILVKFEHWNLARSIHLSFKIT